MPITNKARQAYRNASQFRPLRDREADVFRQTIDTLKEGMSATDIQKTRALADNRRLWMCIIDLMRDPASEVPPELRASILSVGMTVQRAMEDEPVDFDFLISINENFAAGLSTPS